MRGYKITLLSDACISSGDISGTAVDRDSCYDSYGLPYIPAKRIKGCLREIAEEIAHWYLEDTQEDIIAVLFGNGDNGESKKQTNQNTNPFLFITDAFLEQNIKTIHEKITQAREKGYGEYVNPKNLIDNYTYVRYQTAIENESAKRNSLRSIRVVKKGTQFYFQSNIDEFDTCYIEFFHQCCIALCHMGACRTRGLGNVKIEEWKFEELEKVKPTSLQTNQHSALEPDKNYSLTFDIKLETPMIFPKHSIGCPSSETYLPGSSIMGYFANQYRKANKEAGEEIFENLFLNGNIIFQNAYISANGETTMPIPLSLYKEKGKSIGHCPCYEMLKKSSDEKEKSNQEKPMLEWIGDDYCKIHFSANHMVDKIEIKSVAKTLGYHYKGNIDPHNVKENEMFQMIGIEKDQTFKAVITGKGEYLGEILPFAQDGEFITLGTSKTAQYGRGRIQNKKVILKETKSMHKIGKSNKIVLVLKSPCILFDESILSYCTDINVLRQELEKKIIEEKTDGHVSLKCEHSRIQYKTIGGYNTKWRLPKENITAIDAGSAFVFSLEEPKEKIEIDYSNIGEKINEGYGEFNIYNYDSLTEMPKVNKVNDSSRKEVYRTKNITMFEELENILMRRFYKEVREMARINAHKLFDCKVEKEIGDYENIMSSAALNTAFLQLENNITLEDFIEKQSSIKDKDKKKQSVMTMWQPELYDKDNVLCSAKEFIENIKSRVLENYNSVIQGLYKEIGIDTDKVFQQYTHEFLLQARLLLRELKKSK